MVGLSNRFEKSTFEFKFFDTDIDISDIVAPLAWSVFALIANFVGKQALTKETHVFSAKKLMQSYVTHAKCHF
jgi:hypothetical protein